MATEKVGTRQIYREGKTRREKRGVGMSHRSSRDLVRGPSQGEKVGCAEARVGKDCCRTELRGGDSESGLGIRHLWKSEAVERREKA